MADPSESRSGFTRRSFLKGSGAVAAVTSLGTGEADVSADESSGGQVFRDWTEITLHVNGMPHQVSVEPRTTLLELLRYDLNLTGAKPVSRDGSSGASTILIDGRPVMASTTLALAARGKQIQTIENFDGQAPDTIPQAFLAHDAQQCGFCTPGFVIAIRAFLAKHPHATEQQIRQGLNGNLCRCGTYANIVQAALALVRGEHNG